MDGVSELARLFKERENVPYMGPQLGIVVSPLPDIKVKLGDKIILTKQHLVIAAHLLVTESVEYGSKDLSAAICGDLPGADSNSSTVIGSLKFYDGTDYPSTRQILELNITKGTKIVEYFRLNSGDEVILIPSTDAQLYFLIDKAVRP